MNPTQKSNIKDLAEALINVCAKENSADCYETTADFISALSSESDRKKRKKMMKDFAARHADTADFLSKNEALINAEAEAALIGAAVGGNVNALKFLLKSRLPEKYSDKPKDDSAEALNKLDEVLEKIGGNE